MLATHQSPHFDIVLSAATAEEVVDVAHPDEDTRVYAVRGPLFFASSNDLVYQFDYVGDPHNVVIDLSESQICDSSTVAALDAIVLEYQMKGTRAEVIGLNAPPASNGTSSAAPSAPATEGTLT